MRFFDDIEARMEQVRNDRFFDGYIASIKERYDRFKGKEPPKPDYKDFMCFFTTGSREEYENKYFYVRNHFTAAVLLYLCYGEQEYMDEICRMVWHICSELTWCLPAHFPLDKYDFKFYKRMIDLFSAETGRMLTEALYILGDKLPERIRDMIIYEVNDRIIEGFDNNDYWWETKTNNWSAVCAGSVGMTYLYIAPEKFDSVKSRLFSAFDCFFSGYGDDGCSTEGVGYWGYGFGYYLMFADALYRFTDGKEDIRHSKKIDNIARFGTSSSIGDLRVSFADSGRGKGYSNPGIISYIAQNYEGVRVPKITPPRFGGLCKLSYKLRIMLWTDTSLFKDDVPEQYGLTYFENAQWYLINAEKYGFAAKGGHNDEEHNHNDVGSFIFADKEKQLLIDIGQMRYSRDNFNEKRYTFLQNSSRGHSVPLLGGKEQLFGREHSATVLKVNENEFTFEIQNAYGKNLAKVTRSFLNDENGVTLKDTYEALPEGTVERFVSCIEPIVTDDGVIIDTGIIKSDVKPVISTDTAEDSNGTLKTFYLIDYKPNGNEFVLRMEIL